MKNEAPSRHQRIVKSDLKIALLYNQRICIGFVICLIYFGNRVSNSCCGTFQLNKEIMEAIVSQIFWRAIEAFCTQKTCTNSNYVWSGPARHGKNKISTGASQTSQQLNVLMSGSAAGINRNCPVRVWTQCLGSKQSGPGSSTPAAHVRPPSV